MLNWLQDRFTLGTAQAILVFAAVTIWWSAFTTEYGMSDDYIFLSDWGQADFDLWKSDIVKMGRPATALFMRVHHLADDTVAGLARARILSGACLILFGTLLLRYLEEAGLGRLKSLLTSLLILTTPPFVVFLGWAAMLNASLACCLVLAGSHADLKTRLSPRKPHRLEQGRGAMLAVLSIVAACTLYQPAACLFLLLPVAILIGERSVERIRAAGISFALFVAGLGLYFVAYRSAQFFFFEDNWATGRATLVTDYWSKLRYLWQNPITDILSYWTALSKTLSSHPFWLAGLLLSLIALIGFVKGEDSVRRSALIVGMLLIAFALSFAPMAAVNVNVSPFRTFAAPYAIWILILIGGLSKLIPRTLSSCAAYTAFCLFTIGAAYTARSALREGIVLHQHTEWVRLKGAFQSNIEPQTTALLYRMPNTWNNTTNIRTYHEFAVPSTQTQWGVDGLIHAYRRLTQPAPPETMVICIHPWDPLPACKESIPLVDGYDILTGDPKPPSERSAWTKPKTAKIEFAPFGLVSYPAKDVIFSDRFGYARIFEMPEIDLQDDVARAETQATEGITFFLVCAGEVFWTSIEVYPYVVQMDSGQWFTLGEGSSAHPVLIPYVEP